MINENENSTYNAIGQNLLSQFESTWKMLRKAIERCPEEKWELTENSWTFSTIVYHIIETQEFYLRSSPKGMEWNKLLKLMRIKTKNDELLFLSKSTLFENLRTIEEQMTNYFGNITLDELLKKDDFEWFDSLFHKFLYLLRHNAHHLGELGRMLREWNAPRMEWD